MISRLSGFYLLLAAAGMASAASLPSADSQRGKELFSAQRCVECHSIRGQGGKSGPDLGRQIGRDYTPSVLASTMWNHAPTMWSAMKQANIERKGLNEKDAADLFAFFYSSRYFDRPGDASRGKHAFASKRCAECHGIAQQQVSGIPPVSEWKSLGQPIDLAEAMWNHGSKMRQEFKSRNISWQELTSQDLTDILVYLRNLPSTRMKPSTFATTAGDKGAALFESKGCTGCHKGKLDLPPRLKNMTITDIAVAMWNHQPKMAANPPTLEAGEMNEIVSHLWAGQFFADEGNAGRGKAIFAEKGCGGCHGAAGAGAPDLAAHKGGFTSVSMVSGLWGHGPGMLEQMRQKNLAWPRFTPKQMSDLIAFLNSPK